MHAGGVAQVSVCAGDALTERAVNERNRVEGGALGMAREA